MKVRIETGVPSDGTYIVNKYTSSCYSGFCRIGDIPKEKLVEIERTKKKFLEHQSYLRKIYKELGR